MSKKLVVVDVDDVLLDLNESVAERIRGMGYPDYSTSNIVTYNLNKDIDVSRLPEHQQDLESNGLGCPRELVFKCYSELLSFTNAKFTDNLYQGLKELSERFNVMIHTNNVNLSILRYKVDLFETMCSDLGLSYNFCICKEKPVFNNEVYAVFEDCLENLSGYAPETKKILIDRPQNCELFNAELIANCGNLVRVENFYKGVQYLVKEI